MNVSKVSSSSTMTAAAKPNHVISELQKQKVQLKEQISTITASKEDAKVKAAKIKVLNEKIAEIEKQIVQAQIAERQKEIEESQQRNIEKAQMQKVENETQKDGVILSASLNDLISIKGNHSALKEMDGVRRKLVGEMKVAEAQMKNSHNGSIEYQVGVLSKNATKISELADKMADKVDEINKNVEKAKKKGLKEAEKTHSDDKGKEEKDNVDVNNTADIQKESGGVVTEVSNGASNSKNEESKNNEDQEKRARRPKPFDIVV